MDSKAGGVFDRQMGTCTNRLAYTTILLLGCLKEICAKLLTVPESIANMLKNNLKELYLKEPENKKVVD